MNSMGNDTGLPRLPWPEWKYDSFLGHGGFGDVYRIVREDYGETFYAACKIVRLPSDESEARELEAEGISVSSYYRDMVSDLQKEISMMMSLKGAANIVSIEDYKIMERKQEAGWILFIRMELLMDLNQYRKNHPMTVEKILKLGCDICSALDACSKKKIIHRDIKPSNILVLEEFEEFKLGDFGISRRLEHTMSGLSRKGTDAYMAPEVYYGDKYNATVDIYSLGLVLYRLLNNNRLPFEPQVRTSKSIEEAFEKRINGEKFPDPENGGKEIGDILRKACSFDPKKRYQSAAEFKEVLQTYASAAGNRKQREKRFLRNEKAGREENNIEPDSNDRSNDSTQEISESKGVNRLQDTTDTPVVDDGTRNTELVRNISKNARMPKCRLKKDPEKVGSKNRKLAVAAVIIWILVICAGIYYFCLLKDYIDIVGLNISEPTQDEKNTAVDLLDNNQLEKEQEENNTELRYEQTETGIAIEKKEQRYIAVADVNLRADCYETADYVTSVPTGTELEGIGISDNGWIQIRYWLQNQETICYVNSEYVVLLPEGLNYLTAITEENDQEKMFSSKEDVGKKENTDLNTNEQTSGRHHAEIVIKDYGEMDVELYADVAPITVSNFIKLAKEGFYDGLTFHRIVDGFMMQGGDPLGNGTGGSEETIKGEFSENGIKNDLSHTRGAISMARSSDPDSASSQFFIVQCDSTFLDGQYAVFGYITDGLDIVDKICSDAKPSDDNGTIPDDEQPVIERVTIVD